MNSFFGYNSVHEKFFKAHGNTVPFKRGQYLVAAMDESPWVFFLADGLVKVQFGFNNGTERLIGYFLPGMTFAQSGSFFSDSGGELEYIAATPNSVYRIRREVFLQQLQVDLDFSSAYLDMILKNQIFLIERIVYQGENTVEKKFLRWLLFMMKYYGQESAGTCQIMIPITQTEIANFLHTSRVSVSNAMIPLCDKQVISITSKYITVHDAARIKALLEQ